MAHQPWFKFYAGDYLLDAGVDNMAPEAEGLLVRMWAICHLEGSCPDNPEELARKIRRPLQYVLQCKPHCQPLFELQDGRLYSRRMQEEKLRSEQARKNANQRYNQKTCASGSANGTANGTANGIAQSQSQSQGQGQKTTPPNPLKEGEAGGVRSRKRKRRNRTEILAPYPTEVGEIVNSLIFMWPERQPGDKRLITVDVPMLAARIDALLREENVTREMIEESAKLYLSVQRQYYKAPQFFYGIGNGESAHWSAYARMWNHESNKQQAGVQ